MAREQEVSVTLEKKTVPTPSLAETAKEDRNARGSQRV